MPPGMGGMPPGLGMPPGGPPGGPEGDDLVKQMMQMLQQFIPQMQPRDFLEALNAIGKVAKNANSVQALAPKMTATSPFQAPIGRADQAALAQLRPTPGAPMPPPGGMPPGVGAGMLAAGGPQGPMPQMPPMGGMPGGL